MSGVQTSRDTETSSNYVWEAESCVFEDFELFAGEGGFEAVWEADEQFFAGDGRSAHHDANRAAWVDEGVVGSADFDERNDLGKNMLSG